MHNNTDIFNPGKCPLLTPSIAAQLCNILLFLFFVLTLSSDSEGHFDTPEAATPVRAPQPVPGELENNTTNADKTGEATAEQPTQEG